MTRDLRTRSPFGVKRTAPLAWRTTRVRAAGVELAVFEAGSTSPGAPAVVLLHGLGHWSDAAWGRLVPQLAPSCRYVPFRLPAFAASQKPDVRYDLPFFTATFDAAVAELELDVFALVGHSLGGGIAAHYAGAHPHRVPPLALLAPAVLAHPAPHHACHLARGSGG